MPVWAYGTIIGVLGFIIAVQLIMVPFLKKRNTKVNLARQEAMFDKLKVGTKVVILGGIYAEVVKFDNFLVNVKIAENTIITIDKVSIIGIVTTKNPKVKGKFIPRKEA